ncbi:redoxin domain-containing protein [Streptomyces sp. KM273126]|uniref:redoxin domain-containing protein n=1 Tax=Streptomyces sp. KM273126 TaxID=2545247 RepID=UPI0014048E59|nr:redoxin domain-containing protein [Streptomyces sp. KM273126]MBA2813238.1 redoxin domain-containing protein [Streptomyces sp. KM273126]
MSYLATAVAGIGALCLLNLVFALGVIRRLREHSDRLAQFDRPGAGAPDHTVLPAGATVGSFSTETVSGGPLTDEDLADGTLVAFFSPTCKPCQEKLPVFVAALADRPEDEERVLAVVVGDTETSAPMLASLASVVPTVHDAERGAVSSAFAVRAFPACARVGREADGRLVVTQTDVWPRPTVPAAA